MIIPPEKQLNIYLDIDGVILTKDGEPAPFLYDFLEYATKMHTSFWLTTHCKGNADDPCRYLNDKINDRAGWIYRIKPTTWDVLKTDGIDFTKRFVWLDDYIMESEMRVLESHNATKSFIRVDLRNNPSQLRDVMDQLIEEFGKPFWED